MSKKRISEIKYIVVEEKDMVIALFNNTKFDAVDTIDSILNRCHINASNQMNMIDHCCAPIENYMRYEYKYYMPNSFKAVAKCHESDVFDIETGKRIAKERLLKKYNKAHDSKVNLFKKDLKKYISYLSSSVKEIPLYEFILEDRNIYVSLE